MNELGAILLTGLSGLCLTALFLGLEALFPRRLARTALSATEAMGRSLLVGLANVLFFGSVALGLGAVSNGLNVQVLLLPALLILALLTIGLTLGLAAMAGLLGERIAPSRSWSRQRAVGAVVVILGSLTPFVGWFLFFPFLGSLGLGAFIVSWFRPTDMELDKETSTV